MAKSRLYLCLACEKVIPAVLDMGEILTCPDCGAEVAKGKGMAGEESAVVSRDIIRQLRPAVKKAEPLPASESLPEPPQRIKSRSGADGRVRSRRHRGKRKLGKGKRIVLAFFLGWVVLIGLVLGGSKLYESFAEDFTSEMKAASPAEEEARWRAGFLKTHGQEVVARCQGYISETDPFARQDFVLDALRIAGEYARFYEKYNVQTLLPGRKVLRTGVIETALGEGVELLWADPNGNLMETVAFRKEGEWFVDWEQNVRWSELPWSLFLSQVVEKEGKFRVYARRMAAEEESESLRLVLYDPWPLGPMPDSKGLAGLASPTVVVEKEGEAGVKLLTAFEARTDTRSLSSAFAASYPPEFIRVTVRLKWAVDEFDRPVLAITELLSTDWLGSPVRLAEAAAREEKRQGQGGHGVEEGPDHFPANQ